jgi:PBSX family phage portal protein
MTQDSGGAREVAEAAREGATFREAVLKAQVFGERTIPASTVLAQDEQEKGFVAAGAILPPYNPESLAILLEHSNALRQCVDAYCVNVEAFGHRWEPVVDLESDDARERIRAALETERGLEAGAPPPTDAEVTAKLEEVAREMRREKVKLDAFFEFCSVNVSFPELRQMTRLDLETHGNGYWEVLRNGAGAIVQFSYVPGHTIRLMPLDPTPVVVDEPVRVSPFQFDAYKTPRRFRRYVQIYDTRTVYFREFGDPRVMSRKTGRYFESADALAKADAADGPAAELIHFKVHSPRSAYGVPRWIGCLLAVLGSRMAEQVNYLYFDNKSVPPLAILVSGGRVNDETARRIKEFIENDIRGQGNWHKVLVIDAAAADDGSINSGRARIDIKPLTSAQHSDALFQEYDARNIEKVGNAFRLPRILRGDSREVNRATAEAAIAFAEIQVFSPLREQFDFWMNRQILSRMGIRYWRFRSNAPSLRDPAALAGVVRDLVNAAVLTPAEGRELAEGIFNREFRVIDADWTRQPLSLTLAGLGAEMGEPTTAALPGAGRAGAPDEKRPPASQPSGHVAPWLKRARDALRRGDVRQVAEDLVAVRDELRAREEAEAEGAFRATDGH